MALDRINTNGLVPAAIVPPDGSITSAKIADGAVVVADIADGSITSAKIATDAVTSAKLATDAVTTAKLAADAVTATKLADNSVVTANIASGIDLSSKALVLPAGIALQTLTQEKPTSVSYSSGSHKVMEIALTTKKANSIIKIDLHFCDCKPNVSNRDSHNRAYQFGYKTGSASSSAGNYTGRGGRVGGSSNSDNLGMQGSHADGNSPLEQSDVVSGGGVGGEWGNWGSDYEVNQHSFSFEFSPSVAAGTTLQLSFWLKCQATMVFSGCHYFLDASNSYNGATSSMHATEISV